MGTPIRQEAEALINPEGPVEIPPAEQMSLMRRLRQPRTVLSIAVPLAVIVVAVAANWNQMKEVPALIGRANLWLILLAFAVYYVGFPLRGWRWTRLLKGAGYKVKVKDGTEILFLSWLVNCVVPAKLGDLYREHGYGEDQYGPYIRALPLHYCHGVGLAGSEPPFIRHDSDATLEPGMVITVEAYLSVEGMTYASEEDVLITSEGPRILSPLDEGLFLLD